MVATTGAIHSDLALAEYAEWSGLVGKYAYDASRSGSRLQTVPLRSALDWHLYGRPTFTQARLQAAEAPSLQIDPSTAFVIFLLGWAAASFIPLGEIGRAGKGYVTARVKRRD